MEKNTINRGTATLHRVTDTGFFLIQGLRTRMDVGAWC